MTDNNSIPKQVVKQLGELGEEVVKETVKAGGDVVTGVISGKDLVADTKAISEEQKQAIEEQDKQKLNQMRGRNVEKEMEEIRKKKKKKEEEEEQQLLAELKQKREAERMADARTMEAMNATSKPSRKNKGRKPKQKDVSATAEFKAGVD